MSKSKNGFIKNLKFDIPASIVVFFVALPLCLGIALASGAPLFSGVIAGIVGGIVVGSLSGSSFGVSGPAAGLAVIVLAAINDFGSFNTFLAAVFLAGIIQLILGFARAGIIAYYFPSSVIKGMLSGIGIIIFLKQIPHAFGYDSSNAERDFKFNQGDGHNTFSELFHMLEHISMGPVIITAVSLAILLLWERPFLKKIKFFSLVPGSLVAVSVAVILNIIFTSIPSLSLSSEQIVNIPLSEGPMDFFSNFTFPDFSQLLNPDVHIVAITLAVVASIETLLCVEATDKMDPNKGVTPTNRELKAQGIGNMISGLIGGLPITQVIVRSSANIQAKAKSKTSAIVHGILLMGSVMFLPHVLNLIPLSSLAAILLVVGYKLAKPSLFKAMYKLSLKQFVPFVVTIVGIVFTDLLMGIGIGMVVSIFYILRSNYKNAFYFNSEVYGEGDQIIIELSEHVTFLNKAAVLQTLNHLPEGSDVLIDATNSNDIEYDVWEIIKDFEAVAEERGVKLVIKGKPLKNKINVKYNQVKFTKQNKYESSNKGNSKSVRSKISA